MDLSTATPADIDTKLADLYSAEAQLEKERGLRLERLRKAMGHTQVRNARGRYVWPPMSDPNITVVVLEALAAAGENTPASRLIRERFAELETRTEQILVIRAEIDALEAEYIRRGRWTRYYLVDSDTGNGHVHPHRACSTCRPTTRYYWLTSESGKTPEEVVANAKSRACTVCFPWAPVDRRPGVYFTPSELERAAAAKAKAEKAAKKRAAQITTPDGEDLFAAEMRYDRRTGTNRLTDTDRLGTEVAAWRRAMHDAENVALYGGEGPDVIAWTTTIDRCVAALAERRGVTEASLRVEINEKTAAKARRQGWTVKATV